MFSLNAPVPPAVHRLAADLAPSLVGFETVVDDLTLLGKRLDATPPSEPHALTQRVRTALREDGLPPFGVRVTGIDAFFDPPAGSAPVVYLAVESPGLYRLHECLCEVVDPVPGLEGDEYVPHVTVARGGPRADAQRLCERSIDPVSWQVERLHFYDATVRERAGVIHLPA